MKVIKPSYEIYLTPEQAKQIQHNIELYGRVCYKSEKAITDESAKSFIEARIKSGHESIIEHEKVTVRIICDRGVTHELVRHRLASFSQESTRYCNYAKEQYGNEVTFIEPFFFNDDSDAYDAWECAMENAEKAYLHLVNDLGRSPQEARSVLPNSLKTEIVITMNLREWRHFFKLRALGTSGKPHPQMLEITVPMFKDFKKLLPYVFADMEVSDVK